MPDIYFFSRDQKIKGFTIVELLIVIVVIAILAAITIVTFNGIQARAEESKLQADLNNGSKQLGAKMAKDGSYPTVGLPNDIKSAGTTFTYSSDGISFCLTAFSSRANVHPYYVANNGVVSKGACTGHPASLSEIGTIAENSPIQDVNKWQCSALPEFTGSNNDALRIVTDSRGGETKTYRIAKLADGKCWMIDNLKLGSTTGTTTLTPSDTDITSNYVLQQVATTSTGGQDGANVFGPVPGDTGLGTTNYGYLYSWRAATAKLSNAYLPPTNGNAPHSICPKGWRLPNGGANGDFSQLDIAFGGSGDETNRTTAVNAKWRNTGPFKGVLAGYWRINNFNYQNFANHLWTATALTQGYDQWVWQYAYFFRQDNVLSPGMSYVYSGSSIESGYSVRCVLK